MFVERFEKEEVRLRKMPPRSERPLSIRSADIDPRFDGNSARGSASEQPVHFEHSLGTRDMKPAAVEYLVEQASGAALESFSHWLGGISGRFSFEKNAQL